MEQTKRVLRWANNIFKTTESPLGVHLMADLWGVRNLETREEIEKVLFEAAKIANSTPLDTMIHTFDVRDMPGTFGFTGVILLEESHISIHTWPEFEYAGVDVFTCGEQTRPEKALESLQKAFKSKEVQIHRVDRGFRWTRRS